MLVAVWLDGRVLLVKNAYRPQYNFPGGGPKPAEPPAATARRELAEEVGLQLATERLREVGVFRSEFEFRHDSVRLFEAVLTAADRAAPRPDGREVVWGRFCRPATGVDPVAGAHPVSLSARP